MTLQSTVRKDLTTGIVGELLFDTPHIVRPLIVNSSGATPNTVGKAFAHLAGSDDVAVAGGAGAFAGILVHPKHYALQGTAAGTLEPTLDLPDNSNGELLTMGEIMVNATVVTTGAIGDGVFYVDLTGAIGLGTAAAGQTQIAGAKVTRKNIAAPGLAVITLNEA